MKILLITFAIIFALDRLFTNGIKNETNIITKYELVKKFGLFLSILTISEYILGSIIIIKIILKLFN